MAPGMATCSAVEFFVGLRSTLVPCVWIVPLVETPPSAIKDCRPRDWVESVGLVTRGGGGKD